MEHLQQLTRLGDAEVAELDHAARAAKYIVALKVPMDNALHMRA